MSELRDINKDRIFIPLCKECKNVLNIEINPLNFSVEYKCEYNKNHNSSDSIYFKTFERFYLEEKILNNTIKSSNYNELEKNNSHDCCGDNGNNKSFNCLMNNKCFIHKYDFIAYCLDCKSNLFLYCIKENNKHDSHEIKNYIELMPTLNEIENLKKKIEEKINIQIY